MNKNRQRGAATLIYLSLITLIAVLILTVSYSRMLLALRRGQSVSDTIIAGYSAESKINDFLAILLGGYRTFDSYSFPISYTIGGTTLDIDGEKSGNTETLFVTASRYLAVSKLKVTRQAATETIVNDVEVTFALDCTGSMSSPADSSKPTGPTRMAKMKEAAMGFMDNVIDSENKDRYKVGVSTFSYDHLWLKYNGKDVTTAQNLTPEEVRDAINKGFGTRRDNSPACPRGGATSIGSGLSFVNEYYRNNPPATSLTKRVIVLITDGLPNSRIPYDRCPESVFCALDERDCNPGAFPWACYSHNDSVCEPMGLDFLRCTITDETKNWKGSLKGDRNPNVDVYSVTVLSKTDRAADQKLYNTTVDIFSNNSTQYFNTENGADLPRALEAIFSTVDSGSSFIKIEREIPGL